MRHLDAQEIDYLLAILIRLEGTARDWMIRRNAKSLYTVLAKDKYSNLKTIK